MINMFKVAICDLKCKYLKNILQGHILWPWTRFVIEKEDLMNEIIIKDKQIENMIFEVRGVQVMLSSEISVTKWHTIKSLIYLTLRVFIKRILSYQYRIST